MMSVFVLFPAFTRQGSQVRTLHRPPKVSSKSPVRKRGAFCICRTICATWLYPHFARRGRTQTDRSADLRHGHQLAVRFCAHDPPGRRFKAQFPRTGVTTIAISPPVEIGLSQFPQPPASHNHHKYHALGFLSLDPLFDPKFGPMFWLKVGSHQLPLLVD